MVLILVTLYGFATHGGIGTAGVRMLTRFLPLLIGWVMVAPFFGIYNPSIFSRASNLWRPFYAMIIAAPLIAWLRAIMLGNTPIQPIFVVVLGGISALAILAWRGLYWLIFSRSHPGNE